MNLKSHHRREHVAKAFLCETVDVNWPGSYTGFPGLPWAAQRVVANAAMQTRDGLDAAKVERMIVALWECDD
jgi:hypothetical protein